MLAKFFLIGLGAYTAVNAMPTVNLNAYTCNKIKLTEHSSVAVIQHNCKQVKVTTDQQITSGRNAADLRGSNLINEDDNTPTIAELQRLSFYTDDGSYLTCYYRNNKLRLCKAPTKN